MGHKCLAQDLVHRGESQSAAGSFPFHLLTVAAVVPLFYSYTTFLAVIGLSCQQPSTLTIEPLLQLPTLHPQILWYHHIATTNQHYLTVAIICVSKKKWMKMKDLVLLIWMYTLACTSQENGWIKLLQILWIHSGLFSCPYMHIFFPLSLEERKSMHREQTHVRWFRWQWTFYY